MEDDRLKSIEERLSSIDTDVLWIKNYLENDPRTGRIGIIREVSETKAKLTTLSDKVTELVHNNRVDKIIWGTAGGSIVIFLEKIINHFVNNG